MKVKIDEQLVKNIGRGYELLATIDKNDYTLQILKRTDRITNKIVDGCVITEVIPQIASEIVEDVFVERLINLFRKENLDSLGIMGMGMDTLRFNDNTWMMIMIQSFYDEPYYILKAINVTKTTDQLDSANHLFYDSVQYLYERVMKVNLTRDIVYDLHFSNHGVEEVRSDISWTNLYNYIIGTISEDKREEIYAKTNSEVLKSVPSGTSIKLSYRKKHSHSDAYGYYDCYYYIRDNVYGERILTVFIADITDSMNEKESLIRASERDELTFLYNRNKLDRMLMTEYSRLDSCAVFFFDVNNLKTVNDIFGHEAGDKLICKAADSIRHLTNRDIQAYRFGGDEFVLIYQNAKQGDCEAVLEKWQNNLKELNAKGYPHCEIACGYSWSDTHSIPELISMSDKRMYLNKQMIKELKKKETN